MASSFNKVILMGNLTRDPQLKYLPSQLSVAEFGIAMNRRFKTAAGEDRDEVTFVDISAFGKTGEFINQYFTKGKSILIEGRLKYDQWEDKNGGGKRSRLLVIAETVSFELNSVLQAVLEPAAVGVPANGHGRSGTPTRAK